jgi:hypothetical protein
MSELIKPYFPIFYQKDLQQSHSISRKYLRQTKFRELNIFREKIINKTLHNPDPLSSIKKNVLFYQLIFFGIGFFFLFLTNFIFSSKMSWTWVAYFGNSHIAKSMLCILCGIFCMTTFCIGLSLKVEREAVSLLVNKASHKLSRIFSRQKSEYGLHFFSKRSNLKNYLIFRQNFYEALDKIKEIKEETFHIMHKIKEAKNLEEHQKNNLFNQALTELDYELKDILVSFQKKILNENQSRKNK